MESIASEQIPARRGPGGTKGRILNVALRRFQQQGYSGTSIRDIADELGVTKAAVYYHFAAKSELVEELLKPVVAGIAELLDTAGDATTQAERAHFLCGFVDLLSESGPRIAAIMGDPEVREFMNDHINGSGMPDRVVDLLARGLLVAGTESELVLARIRATVAMSCLPTGLQAWSVEHPGRDQVDAASRELILNCMLRVLGDK